MTWFCPIVPRPRPLLLRTLLLLSHAAPAAADAVVTAVAAAADAEDLATLVGSESTSRRLQGRAFVGGSKVTQTRFLRKERPIPYYIPKWQGRRGGGEEEEGRGNGGVGEGWAGMKKAVEQVPPGYI